MLILVNNIDFYLSSKQLNAQDYYLNSFVTILLIKIVIIE